MKEVNCIKCKKKINIELLGNIKYCPYCGAKLNNKKAITHININRSKKDYVKFYKESLNYLNKITPQKVNVYDYFHIKEKKYFKDIVYTFFSTLQDYQSLPNIIGLNSKPERKPIFNKIFFNYDIKKILNAYNPDSLFKTFCKNFPVRNAESKANSWRRYARGIIDVCKYLSRFNNAKEFNDYVRSFNGSLDVVYEFKNNIYCMGFALACNAIKDLGFEAYCKPDVHLIDVLTCAKFCDNNQEHVFYIIKDIADANGVSSYQVDSTIWLICSGFYYKHDVRTDSHKKEYINMIKKNFAQDIT